MTDKFNIKKPTLTMVLKIIFSLLCALLLWVYVTSTESDDYTERFTNIPVVFEGEATMRESRGLVITSQDVTSVNISISGSRRVVYKLDEVDLTAVVDLSNISTTGHYDVQYRINYPTGVDSSSLTVSAKSPETVSLVVDKLSRKTVEVYGVFNGSPDEGYSAEPLEFSPNTVTIYGPQNALEMVDKAWVEVSREDVDKTLTFESDFVLVDADGNVVEDASIEAETDTVTVTLPIISIKDIDLTIRILPGGGATEDNVKYSIDPSSITLSGDSDTLAGTNNIDIATIDLAEVDGSMTETFKIIIPNNTEILNGPQEATVTLEITGLEKKRVNVTNFSCTNVTEGYEADIMVDSLDVDIRGTEDVLKNISDINVRAVADLTDFGTATGILLVPVKIYVDGTTEAGAIGEYKVYVNVSVAN